MRQRRNIPAFICSFGLMMLYLFFPIELLAQATASEALTEFQEITSYEWRRSALNIGLMLFITLATLDFIIFGISLKFSEKDVPVLNTIIKKILILAIFFTILILVWFLDEIVYGFQQFAAYITGEEEVYTEVDILGLGFQYFWHILTPGEGFWERTWSFMRNVSGMAGLPSTPMNTFKAHVSLGAAILILIAFFIIAIQYAYLTIEIMITLAISPIFMGMLPMKISRVYPERYLSYIVHLGVKVFLFYILLGFMMSVLTVIINNLTDTGAFEFGDHMGLLFMSFLAVTILGRLPDKMAQFITENQNLELGKLVNRINEL